VHRLSLFGLAVAPLGFVVSGRVQLDLGELRSFALNAESHPFLCLGAGIPTRALAERVRPGHAERETW
jgi:hypothetical protein